MPQQGLWRAGRWDDVERFPPPPRSIQRQIWSPGSPLLEGYRWEDAFGRFSTAKLSASDEAAVGRTLARYRRREVGGISILDKMKGFLSNGGDDPDEPELVTNTVPKSYFEDACLVQIEYDSSMRFIDVEHAATREFLLAELSEPLRTMDHDLSGGLSGQRDRRLTRLVTSTLYEICAEHRRAGGALQNVAGIKYEAPDKHWDAYVVWDRPSLIDLSDAKLTKPLFPDDPAVQKAANTLGLMLP